MITFDECDQLLLVNGMDCVMNGRASIHLILMRRDASGVMHSQVFILVCIVMVHCVRNDCNDLIDKHCFNDINLLSNMDEHIT